MLSFSTPATVAVDKATSDLLISPDWALNIEICNNVNSSQWQVKDVVKAVKKRLQHKDPVVQQLALTLLDTLVNNCGDSLHHQIAERNILGEMVKIMKKADTKVRGRILVMLDSWREAFGGLEGKYPQYYSAYLESRRSIGENPKGSPAVYPVIKPPGSRPILSGTSTGLDETTATEVEGWLSSLESMRNAMDLLSNMLESVDPSDLTALNNEVIVDLVDRCRSNQKTLMQILTSTGDDEVLDRGIHLNDSLRDLLAKHDAIAYGYPLPFLALKPADSSPKSSETKDSSSVASSSSPILAIVPTEEYEDDEDEFAQLARRHSRSPTSESHNALALIDQAPPVNTTEEQDMIDLFSITLSTPLTPPSLSSQPLQDLPQFDSYVAPWAQPQQQAQTQHGCSQEFQMQQPTSSQNPFDFPPPPWASESADEYYTSQANATTSYTDTSALAGDPKVTSTASIPFVQSYMYFDDLDEFGNTEGKQHKSSNSKDPSQSLS